jgi:hypothetical protein
MVYQHRLYHSLLITIVALLSLYLVLRAFLNFAANTSLLEIVLGLLLLSACWLLLQSARQGQHAPALEQGRAKPSQQEERLEEVYRRAVAAADCVLYRKDERNQTYTFMGEGIYKLTGYTVQEMTPELWSSICKIDLFRGELAGLTFDEAFQKSKVASLMPGLKIA